MNDEPVVQVGRYHSVEEAEAARGRPGPAHDVLSLKAFEEVGRLMAENEKLRARKSILQDWVTGLGLRHQGVLLTVVRGCDTAPKDDPSKLLTRSIRAVLLNPHCGDVRKAATFMEYVDSETLNGRFEAFRKNLDHYPHHYVMHVTHAIEIIGYKHPDKLVRISWRAYYRAMCRGLHVNPETEAELDERLDADEETFAARDRSPLNPHAPAQGGGGGS